MRIVVAMAGLLAGLACPAVAQQADEMFLGGRLRPTHGSGVTVATTRRYGAEILRIRATSDAAGAFLRRSLPSAPASSPYRIYSFNITIGPGLPADGCTASTAAKADFQRCLANGKFRREGVWRMVDAGRSGGGRAVLARTAGPLPVYANCWLYRPARPGEAAVQSSCAFSFEQDGFWMSIDTTARALKDFRPYQCAAFRMLDAIWEHAPAIPPTCGKPA